MTDRLYYDAPDLLEFDALVTRLEPCQEGARVWLDRSAFYPTSGGQPHDTGELGGFPVADVAVEDGDVVHTVLGAPALGERVRCRIDGDRRRDHMQQHCGEHMLAHTVWKRLGGYTHGLHTGAEVSTIDVTLPDGATHIPDKTLASMEEEINAWIQRDEEVRCWFPTPEELATVPLRKPSSVTEHVRVVHIAPEEYCACGGTHPRRTGEIGCLRILEARPSRGKVRIAFLCGMRAVRDARARAEACGRAAEILSTQWEELPAAVERLSERAGALAAQLRAERKAAAVERLRSLAAAPAPGPEGSRLVAASLPGLDMGSLREAANAAVGPGTYVLLVSPQEEDAPAPAVFLRGEGCSASMRALFAGLTASCGGKGGGRDDFAQGSFPDGEAALRLAVETLGEERGGAV